MAFMRSVVLPQQEMSVDEFKKWLKQFDVNHDGRISREELKRALESLHAWFAWWKARQALKSSDVNRNGVIDKEEIGKLVLYAVQHLNMKIYD
ncbi:EF-hand-containing protein [Dioscorea alata]|uniref:EF-hand-containing protein n=1 Tax=Dioscorea alata TaxID=55571 RepID=A0ACB7VY61_DIOAL|nr:EF-hand-containing protein [Dioscorea alata]